MDLRKKALQAANIADRLTWASRHRHVDGQKVLIVTLVEAHAMKLELLEISHALNDIQDMWDKHGSGAAE